MNERASLPAFGLFSELVDEVVDAAAERAAAIVLERLAATSSPMPTSEFLSVPEAAELLRCKRQRVDDLLSRRRLTRYKDGARTLVSRAELLAYIGANGVAQALPTGPRSRMTNGVAG